MGIIDAIFFKYFGPVFIKEDSDVKPYIEKRDFPILKISKLSLPQVKELEVGMVKDFP